MTIPFTMDQLLEMSPDELIKKIPVGPCDLAPDPWQVSLIVMNLVKRVRDLEKENEAN